MTSQACDDAHMGLALAEADAALREFEVPVGCVFVHETDGVLGRGHLHPPQHRHGA